MAPVEHSGDFSRTELELSSLREGDAAAFERIWTRYQPALELCIGRQIRLVSDPRLRAELELDDLLQDASIVVLRRLRDFEYRGPGSLFAWLQMIAHNIVLDHTQRALAAKRGLHARRSISARSTTEPGELDLPSSKTGPATRAIRNDEWRRLAAVLVNLPAREFELILLRHYHGASWEEVAEHFDAPSPDAARKEHARLLQRLGLQLDRSRTNLP